MSATSRQCRVSSLNVDEIKENHHVMLFVYFMWTFNVLFNQDIDRDRNIKYFKGTEGGQDVRGTLIYNIL